MSDQGGVWAWIGEGVRELFSGGPVRSVEMLPPPRTCRDRDGIERPYQGCLGAFAVDEDGQIIR